MEGDRAPENHRKKSNLSSDDEDIVVLPPASTGLNNLMVMTSAGNGGADVVSEDEDVPMTDAMRKQRQAADRLKAQKRSGAELEDASPRRTGLLRTTSFGGMFGKSPTARTSDNGHKQAKPFDVALTLKEAQNMSELLYYTRHDQLDKFKEFARKQRIDLKDRRSADCDGRTPLHVAAACAAVRVAQHLLAEGAQVNALDNFHRTPLRDAMDSSCEELQRMLMAQGGVLSMGNGNGSVNGSRHGGGLFSDNGHSNSGRGLGGPPGVGISRLSSGLAEESVRNNGDWEIDPDSLTVADTPMATGAFGEVFKCSWRGATVVVKRLKTTFENDQTALNELRAELAVWCRLHHPNICHFLGAVTTVPGYPPTLVAELCEFGSLQALLQRHHTIGNVLKWDDSMRYACGIGSAMQYLHSRQPIAIVHRDLKPANCLIDGSNNIKLTDFGLSKMLTVSGRRVLSTSGPARPLDLDASYHGGMDGERVHIMDKVFTMSGETGAYKYMAPEVFRHERYGMKCDVYSFAIILYEMVEGLYVCTDPASQAAKAAGKEHARPTCHYMVALNSRRSRSIEGLIKQCWAPVGYDRPTFEQIVSDLHTIRKYKEWDQGDGGPATGGRRLSSTAGGPRMSTAVGGSRPGTARGGSPQGEPAGDAEAGAGAPAAEGGCCVVQ